MKNTHKNSKLTVSQVAELFGVTTRTVQLWRAQGLPFEPGEPGRPNRYNLHDVVSWGVSVGKLGSPSSQGAAQDERAERAALLREQKEFTALKKARLAGELLERAEVAAGIERAIAVCKKRLLHLPTLADQLEGLPRNEIRGRLKTVVYDALADLAHGLGGRIDD